MAAIQRTRVVKRAARVLLVAYALALVTGTHIPTPPEALVGEVSDKWLHFTAYLGLSFLVCLDVSLRRALNWRACAAIFGLLAVFAAMDEVTQIPFNRTADVWDWAADAIGTLSGMAVFLAAAVIYRWFRRDSPLRA